MKETEMMMEQLILQIKRTNEYNQYQNLLERVKSQEELYRRIGEYRRRSLTMQVYAGDDFIQENNMLQKEFLDLQNNGLAGEFFAAEHQYCTMVKRLQNQFLEGVQLDTSFLEE